MNKTSRIRTKGLTRTYHVGAREIPVLQGIDLDIPAGKLVSLHGRSGSGKTTLLNCISGLDTPTSGQVWIEGQEVTRLREKERIQLRRHKLGFVFQSHALLATYSASENVDLILRLAGWSWTQRKERVEQVLTLVGLKSWMDHRPFEMSGGQQQRVAIARAIAPKPDIILADEPTGELDTATGLQILQIFKHITEAENTTVLVATHDFAVDALADAVYYLEDGQIVQTLNERAMPMPHANKESV
ncbi:ABC transporter, ATP-binding protein [hydrothermal vent metagenome]|uniref:ABC transporter, ATP-binding protein n=1 Tax=hydrothermal vent metagenome TaxID=652676 RepID=A0A3B0UZH5_9ZZZZ